MIKVLPLLTKLNLLLIYTGIEILNGNDMYLIQMIRESKSIFQNKLLKYSH